MRRPAFAGTYQPRPISYLGRWEMAGCRLKAYGVTQVDDRLDGALVDAVRLAAESLVTDAAARGGMPYGVGFAGIHQGRGVNVAFVDWWEDENELRHHAYTSPMTCPHHLSYASPSGLLGCVWDIAIVHFERTAWVRHVLAGQGPDPLADYLEETFSGMT